MTTLKSLETKLRIRIGDTKEGAWTWESSELLNAIETSLNAYHSYLPPQEFEILGVGDDRYYNPTPGVEDENLLLLFAEKTLCQAEMRQSIRGAISRTTPLGQMTRTAQPGFWREEMKRIEAEIAAHQDNVNHKYVQTNIEAKPMSISQPELVATQTVTPSVTLTEKLIANTVSEGTF